MGTPPAKGGDRTDHMILRFYDYYMLIGSVVIGMGHVHGRDGTGHVRDMSKKFSNIWDIGTLKKP